MPNDHRLPLSLNLLFWSTKFQQTICTSKTSTGAVTGCNM
jgi:hypothetical protein